MTIDEMKAKAEKLAGVTKTPEENLQEIANKLQITHN